MGLKDVAALAEVVVDAARLGIDIGQADVLDRYQRWRRFDTMAMGLATNSLNVLFSDKSKLLRAVRDIGLGLVDRAPPLKSMFIRQAAGLAGEVPRLLKGEALSAVDLVVKRGLDQRIHDLLPCSPRKRRHRRKRRHVHVVCANWFAIVAGHDEWGCRTKLTRSSLPLPAA